VTAKQALLDLVHDLTEDQAADLMERLQAAGAIKFKPMTPEQRASLQRGIAQTDAGLAVPHSEVLRRFRRS
jgi:predicted transcriptional regulator